MSISLGSETPARAAQSSLNRAIAACVTVGEGVAVLALTADVAIVFISVIFRYFLHRPLGWVDEIARSLMLVLVFFGAAAALGRGKHVGVHLLGRASKGGWQSAFEASGMWLVALTCAGLAVSAGMMFSTTLDEATPFGMPYWVNSLPVFAGGALLALVALAQAGRADRAGSGAIIAAVLMTLAAGAITYVPALARPLPWMSIGFAYCLVCAVPIAFTLSAVGFIYFVLDPTLPIAVYSQQIAAGTDQFVLLAIPFFVLAGLLMEANGMSARLIELLMRMFGRLRGGLNLIVVLAMAFFSGISGSKLADVTAVGAVLMPAVRRCRQEESDAAALLAASAVMAETIPPCINIIIFGFVANVSIGALFVAGLAPAAFLALCLGVMAVVFGKRVDVDIAFPHKRPLLSLIGGAVIGLVMILMIGKGVASGVATSTEISAFAVVYALAVGAAAFRELSWRQVYRQLADSASLAGAILLVVGAASGVSFVLTFDQVPQSLAAELVALGARFGSTAFMLLSIALLVVFGAVLEGAPALIIFGPMLTPAAHDVGIDPVHYGIVLIVAMGLGLFSPPFGLGLYATCAVAGTSVRKVARPLLKYMIVLLAALVVLALTPSISLWLPHHLNLL